MPTRTVDLFLLRHAHAGDPARWAGPDELRPLSAKGRAQAERIARHLRAVRSTLDVVISSPKVRARETAEPVAKAFGLPVQIDDRLAGGLTLATLDELLVHVGNPSSAMVVGHDPDFSDLAAELAGASSMPLKKGTIVRFDAARPLATGAATLAWLIPPDALPDLGD